MTTLKSKFHGCIAASWAGSAMGAVVEGWPLEKIEEAYGVVDELLPYKHYIEVTDWQRAAGTTEDGIERQKLMNTAIIEKGGRIKAHDLVRVWLRDLDPKKMLYKQERFDRSLLELARAGVPPVELGRLWPYPNVVSMARSSHCIGLINAGDPKGAADDTIEVGKVYLPETAFGLRWAGLYNAAIAEACRPKATVASVLKTAVEFADYRAEAGQLYKLYDDIRAEVERAIEISAKHSDPVKMREEFYRHYHGGEFFNYGLAQANEIVAKGLAVFAFSKGDPKRAIIIGTNFGRDTDCLAAVAGGLSGALSGVKALPAKWVKQVESATKKDKYTNSKRGVAATADGLYKAYQAEHKRAKRVSDEMLG